MQSHSRHAAPLFIREGQLPSPLKRVELGRTLAGGERREKFIEDLVFIHPTIIPMHEIEPAFMPLVPICKQLSTPAGELDNLWLTPAGGIVLGECKLVRNTQARREVLVQALDYARALKSWHYDDLQNAVRKARAQPGLTLWNLVKQEAELEESGLEESQFIDAVERRLRNGRFVVLVIGDGIQEGLEGLTSYLQMHAGLHASIALVELSIWEGIDGGLLIVPRIPMRTLLIERGIVVIEPEGRVRIDPPRDALDTKPVAYAASEPEFYEKLERRAPGFANRLRQFVASLDDIGIVPEYGRTLILRWNPSPEVTASAGYIEATGAAWLSDAVWSATKLGNSPAGYAYLDKVARMVGATVQRYENPNSMPRLKGPDGRTVNISQLLTHSGEWKAAIAALIAETNQTSSRE